MMIAEAERTAQRWRDSGSVDLGAAMTELTLRVVSRSLFSHEVANEVEAITGGSSEIMKEIMKEIIGRIMIESA